MSMGVLLIVGFVLATLVVGLYAMITNPRDIDIEEEVAVVEEQREKKRWWRRG